MNNNMKQDSQKSTVKEHFEDKALFWDDIYANESENTPFFYHEMRRRKEIVFNLLKSRTQQDYKEAVDVGCGAGYYVAGLMDLNMNTIGSDISKSMVEITKSNLVKQNKISKTLLCADCEYLPYPSNHFDVVLCIGVLSYVSNELAILKELKRIVKKNGIIVFNVPNALKLRNVLDPYYYLIRGWKHTSNLLLIILKRKNLAVKVSDKTLMDAPQNRYTINQIDNFLSEAALEKIDVQGYCYGPLRIWRKNILSKRFSIRLSRFLEKIQLQKLFRFLQTFAVGWVIIAKAPETVN